MAESLLERSTRRIDESRCDDPRSTNPTDGSLLTPDASLPGFAPSAQD